VKALVFVLADVAVVDERRGNKTRAVRRSDIAGSILINRLTKSNWMYCSCGKRRWISNWTVVHDADKVRSKFPSFCLRHKVTMHVHNYGDLAQFEHSDEGLKTSIQL
jgi:hypothetical protein